MISSPPFPSGGLPPYAPSAPVYAAPVPVARQAAAPAPAPSPLSPRIAYKPLPVPETTSVAPPRRELGMIVCGLLLSFSAMLLAIACIVQVHAYATAAEHFAANASLTTEARELGIESLRQSAALRGAVFGPGALAFGIAAIVFLWSGVRAPRRRR